MLGTSAGAKKCRVVSNALRLEDRRELQLAYVKALELHSLSNPHGLARSAEELSLN